MKKTELIEEFKNLDWGKFSKWSLFRIRERVNEEIRRLK